MSPVSSSSEFPRTATGIDSSSDSKETKAMSILLSAPTSFPSNSRSSFNLIEIFEAFPAT